MKRTHDISKLFDIENRTISGHEDTISEDMRDYLRRRGIKIFTQNQSALKHANHY